MTENDKSAAGRRLILLVDDEQEMLDLYGITLKKAGFDVVTAHNGPEGLKLAKEKKPALVLLDFKMADMDGVEVLEKMKQDAATRDLKVVFLSAFGDPMIAQTDYAVAKELGGTDFIKKGLGLDEFIKKVKGYLG